MISKRYHHGNLRAALLSEAFEMLADKEAEELSLRSLARRLGVSAPSVYRHFPDKEALLAQIAREGLARMAEMQRHAALEAKSPQAALAATGRAYVRFAVANPVLFRLIFASSAAAGEIRGSESFGLLREHTIRALPKTAGQEAIDRSVLRSWTVAHGMAMLILDGRISVDDEEINALFAIKPLSR